MPQFVKIILIIGAILIVFNLLQDKGPDPQAVFAEARTAGLVSANGFLPVPMPRDARKNTVIIFAPANCPREDAQRARALAKKLTDLGIPNVQSSSYNLNISSATPELSEAIQKSLERLDVVMRGKIPAVLVNGMGKANPAVEEVVREFRSSQ